MDEKEHYVELLHRPKDELAKRVAALEARINRCPYRTNGYTTPCHHKPKEGKTMQGWEAVKALSEGKMVRRAKWNPDKYCFYDDDRSCVRMGGSGGGCMSTPAFFSDDWELYEEPGRDWAWACEQLLSGRKVMQKNCQGWFFEESGVIFYKDQYVNAHAAHMTTQIFTAADWILAEGD